MAAHRRLQNDINDYRIQERTLRVQLLKSRNKKDKLKNEKSELRNENNELRNEVIKLRNEVIELKNELNNRPPIRPPIQQPQINIKKSINKSETGPVPSKDTQTPPPFSFNPIFMKDVQCAKSNEKSIFPFFSPSYREKSSKIESKMTITRNIKIGKI